MHQDLSVNPNYSEKEVWALLIEYLELKFEIDPETVELEIYAEHTPHGSRAYKKDCDDEVCTIICYRNIYYNISGSLYFKLNPEKNDVFNLSEICKYLGKPFPKPVDSILELSTEELEEKQENITFAKEVYGEALIREKALERSKQIAMSLIYAFEYERAKEIDHPLFHIEQLIDSVEDFNFTQRNTIDKTDNLVIIHPFQPKLSELNKFILKKRDFIKDNYFIESSYILDVIKKEIFPNYLDIFSNELRHFGCLIAPLENLDGEIISSIAISNTYDQSRNESYKVYGNNENTIGFINHNKEAKNDDFIFLTISIQNADLITKVFPEHRVYASVIEENFINLFNATKGKFPDSYIVVVLDHIYMQIAYTGKASLINDSAVNSLALTLYENTELLKKTAIVHPMLDVSDPINMYSFHDIYLSYGFDEIASQLEVQLIEFLARLENNSNELEYLMKFHKENQEKLKESQNKVVPDISPQNTTKNKNTFNLKKVEQTFSPIQSENAVFQNENEQAFMDWLNEPLTEAVVESNREFTKKMAQLISASPSSKE